MQNNLTFAMQTYISNFCISYYSIENKYIHLLPNNISANYLLFSTNLL